MKTLTWQKPGQQNVAQELIKIIINYVAELRIYRDYGSDKEFLYARAIQEITGQAPVPTTRSAETLMRGKALKVPAIYRRGHEGMIKLPK